MVCFDVGVNDHQPNGTNDTNNLLGHKDTRKVSHKHRNVPTIISQRNHRDLQLEVQLHSCHNPDQSP